jgi:hypothetical protein
MKQDGDFNTLPSALTLQILLAGLFHFLFFWCGGNKSEAARHESLVTAITTQA